MADGADRRLVLTFMLWGKAMKAPRGVVYHCGGTQLLENRQKRALNEKTLCLMETQRVCNGTITGLQLHPNVPLTPLLVLHN